MEHFDTKRIQQTMEDKIDEAINNKLKNVDLRKHVFNFDTTKKI